jgi:hypothetical protein
MASIFSLPSDSHTSTFGRFDFGHRITSSGVTM